MTLTAYDEFSGVGGTSKGASYVPGVEVTDAANHDKDATDSHALNFPNARHYTEDVTKLDMDRMPRADLFFASPVCPPWTTANGVRRDFDKVNSQQTLFGDAADDADDNGRKESYRRARLLMNEVPRYLRAVHGRGRPVLAGMVENVIQCRLWSEWDRWIGEFHKLDYETELLALNAMHIAPVRAPKAPQSRNRLILAYWHRSLGRRPDFDKWLRPNVWCEHCNETVSAIKVWKEPGRDMGSYKAQYIYQCPRTTCRSRELVPDTLPALSVIDPTIPGIRIGDRADHGRDPLVAATLGRIAAGVRKYWLPLLTPVGGTWRSNGDRGAQPLAWPMPTRTTRECDGIAVPPLLVPVEGRPGKVVRPATEAMRTQTTRAETGYATLPLPFITPLRGGGDKLRARSVTEPLSTVTAGGNHHGLAAVPADWDTWASQLLVPYYGSADAAQPAMLPVGTLTTRDRYGLAAYDPSDLAGVEFDLSDVLFRMLEPHEVGRAQAFEDDYQLAPRSKRKRVRLYGNAVPPPMSEVVTSALVEAITGEELPR